MKPAPPVIKIFFINLRILIDFEIDGYYSIRFHPINQFAIRLQVA